MSTQEKNPNLTPEEPVERFEGDVIDGELKKLRTKEQMYFDKKESRYPYYTSSNEQQITERTRLIQEEMIEHAVVNNVPVENEAIPTENRTLWKKNTGVTPQGGSWLKKAKNSLMGLLALGFSTAAKSEITELPLTDSTKHKTETVGKTGIPVYTTSKTKEGAITPTGYSNSFLENEYGVTTVDLDSIAKTYGFKPETFQKDMLDYVATHKPALLQKVLEKYGQTEYGKEQGYADMDPQGLYDGKLGVRDAFIAFELKKELAETDPYKNYAAHGEPLYSPGAGGRAIGELCYPTVKTSNITDAGNLNTQTAYALFRERKDDFGFTGKAVELSLEEFQKYFGGTRHIKDAETLELLQQKMNSLVLK